MSAVLRDFDVGHSNDSMQFDVSLTQAARWRDTYEARIGSLLRHTFSTLRLLARRAGNGTTAASVIALDIAGSGLLLRYKCGRRVRRAAANRMVLIADATPSSGPAASTANRRANRARFAVASHGPGLHLDHAGVDGGVVLAMVHRRAGDQGNGKHPGD